jgi:hypothetical protein
VVILTLAFSGQLITVWIITISYITLAWSTDRVTPPVCRTRLFNLILAVPARYQRGHTVTGITPGVINILGAGSIVQARIQPAEIKTLVSNISLLAGAGLSVPGGLTGGLYRTGFRGAGVWAGTACLHVGF